MDSTRSVAYIILKVSFLPYNSEVPLAECVTFPLSHFFPAWFKIDIKHGTNSA